jgi:hypothetical protein
MNIYTQKAIKQKIVALMPKYLSEAIEKLWSKFKRYISHFIFNLLAI